MLLLSMQTKCVLDVSSFGARHLADKFFLHEFVKGY